MALVLTLPASAAAQGFTDQRSAAQDQYCDQPGQCPPPPGQGGTPPGQGGTPPGQGSGNPGQGNGPKPKGTRRGSGNVQGTGNGGKKDGSGTLGDTEDGAVGGAGGSGGGPGGSALGADTTGSLERAGSLPFTGLELWLLVAIGLAALGAGLVTRRASRGPAV